MWSFTRQLLRYAVPHLNKRRIAAAAAGNHRSRFSSAARVAGIGSGLCAIGVTISNSLQLPTVKAEAHSAEGQQQPVSWRQQRFLAFASLEYEGVAYMTPRDFLRCVTSQKQKFNKGRTVLTKSRLDKIIRCAPFKWRASETLFTDMGSNGIISFEEFLLLISILNKSSAGYELAFRVFDRNRDGSLDANEFKVLYKITGSLESLDNSAQHITTSLSFHFFGSNQTGTLNAKEFHEFAENLQKEILFVEFQDAARGGSKISQTEFAEALLQRTQLSDSDKRLRLELLHERQNHQAAIDSKQFLQFFLFLRHISDLFFALRMYEISGQSISQDDFQQAVKAITGSAVPPLLLKIVFDLFDISGDGCLSYSEFLNLFGDYEAVKKVGPSNEPHWKKFRKCVTRKMMQ